MASRGVQEIRDDLKLSLTKLLQLRDRIVAIEKDLTVCVVQIMQIMKDMESGD